MAQNANEPAGSPFTADERKKVSSDLAINNTLGEHFGISALSAEAWLAAIVENSDDAIVSKTVNGTITSWNRSAERLFGFSAAEAMGRHISIIIPDDRLHEEDTIIDHIRNGRRIEHFETMRQHKDGTLLDISLTISPVRDKDGVIVGASKIVRDISERKRLIERQDLLLREMNHRVKNLFAVMNSLVSLSERTTTNARALADDLRARIRALSVAHNLVLGSSGGDSRPSGSASLFNLIQALFAAHQDHRSERITVKGDDIAVGTVALTSIALLLHELITNSIKYGALSASGGHIDVEVQDEDGLELHWAEVGGPPIQAPSGATGFGSRLERLALDALNGSIIRDWRSEGLRISLRIPLRSLG